LRSEIDRAKAACFADGSSGTFVLFRSIHAVRRNPDQSARLKEAKGIGTPATRDTIIDGLKRQHLFAVENGKLKASELAMAVYALLRREAPAVLDPAATAEMELALDGILATENETGPVVSTLVDRAAAFNGRCGRAANAENRSA